MAKEIVFKKRFINSLTRLLIYVKKEWNEDVANNFLVKLDKRLQILTHQPYSGAPSQIVSGIRGILITPHNKVFYKGY